MDNSITRSHKRFDEIFLSFLFVLFNYNFAFQKLNMSVDFCKKIKFFKKTRDCVDFFLNNYKFCAKKIRWMPIDFLFFLKIKPMDKVSFVLIFWTSNFCLWVFSLSLIVCFKTYIAGILQKYTIASINIYDAPKQHREVAFGGGSRRYHKNVLRIIN